MTPEDDLEGLFQSLPAVVPSGDLMRRVREIPLTQRRSEGPSFSFRFWDFRLALGLAASLIGGIWLGSTDLVGYGPADEVQAFLELDAGQNQAEPFDVGLLE